MTRDLVQVRKDVRDTRDRVIRIEEAVIHIKETISALPCKEHITRINNLEHFKTKLFAYVTTISFIISLIGKAVYNKLTGG